MIRFHPLDPPTHATEPAEAEITSGGEKAGMVPLAD